jgi:DNA-binding XRE family transcriptional regulator
MSMSAADGVGYVPFLTAARLSLRCERERPKPRPLERVGDHVRERRTELGLTQAQAAARIGICRDALARWEVRPMMPDVHTMPAVIAFLGYNPLPSAHTFQELLLRTRRTLGLDQASLADVKFATYKWSGSRPPRRRPPFSAPMPSLSLRRTPSRRLARPLIAALAEPDAVNLQLLHYIASLQTSSEAW